MNLKGNEEEQRKSWRGGWRIGNDVNTFRYEIIKEVLKLESKNLK